jgi:hypothetical protein
LRRSLSAAAICIIMFFVIQQSVIINKIGLLEDRVVEVSTQNILEQHKENAHTRAVVFNEPEQLNLKDSIKVSSKDLGDLLRSYRELQDEYERIKEELRKGDDIVN